MLNIVLLGKQIEEREGATHTRNDGALCQGGGIARTHDNMGERMWNNLILKRSYGFYSRNTFLELPST